MGKIQIVKEDIVRQTSDAIVNAANEKLQEGSGVCGAIFRAAGARELRYACDQIGECPTGSAVITPAFKLSAKYIIHAVGPRWYGGKQDEAKLLRSAYLSSLSLAVQHGCETILFPLISVGNYGYPPDKAWREAIEVCTAFLRANPSAHLQITFAVIDDKNLVLGKRILDELCKDYTSLYLTQLENDSLLKIKFRIQRDWNHIVDAKDHPMACSLMDVLFDPPVAQNLTAQHMVQICEALFPASVLEESWLARYADILVRVLEDRKAKTMNARANKYEMFLREVLLPEFRKGTDTKDVLDDLEPLVDLYKVTACLLRSNLRNEKNFEFEASIEDMERLNIAIRNVKSVGNNILGIAFDPIRQEDRHYALFLSWLLEELLIKQDCVS